MLVPLQPAVALLAAVLVAPSGFESARATIDGADVRRDLEVLASPELEGRDSPSAGLAAAAAHIGERFRACGVEPAGEDGAYALPFSRRLLAPDPAACAVAVRRRGGTEELALGESFVPLPRSSGRAEGALVFLGFGISAPDEGYDDLGVLRLGGRVAVVLDGEPRLGERFAGDAVSDAAHVYAKVQDLERSGADGVVVVRRRGHLGYRYTWAEWNRDTTDALPDSPRRLGIPVVEIGAATAERLLGVHPDVLAAEIERTGRPLRRWFDDVQVQLAVGFRGQSVAIDNVAGVVRGSDPRRADEYVVVGAHYDHLGVDVLGRVGHGADDNASGTAALLEVAEAFAAAPPARSVLFCAFAGEEDGLLGSRAFVRRPPVPRDAMVAMLNLDMIGRGDPALVVVLGTRQNPGLERVLERARELAPTGIDELVLDDAQHLWQRSDHYPFHEAGLPVLFFFEARSERENDDYHTYRDTLELVSVEKVTNTTALVFNCAWLLANDEERPAPPRR